MFKSNLVEDFEWVIRQSDDVIKSNISRKNKLVDSVSHRIAMNHPNKSG
jgi:hypothetical protein